MKRAIYFGVATVVAVIIILVEYRQWRLSMYKEMTNTQIVDVETGELMFLFAGVGLVLLLVALLVALLRGNHVPIPVARYDDGTTILPRSPQAHVQAPLRINVPRLVSMNQSRPYGLESRESDDDEMERELRDTLASYRPQSRASVIPAQARPPQPAREKILSTTYASEDGSAPVQVEVSLDKLYQFAALDGPVREGHWRGKTTHYTAALRFFTSQGFLTKDGKWKSEYPKEDRFKWLEQFEDAQG